MKKREKFVILILFLLILREFYGLAIKKEILLMYKNEKNIIIDEKDIRVKRRFNELNGFDNYYIAFIKKYKPKLDYFKIYDVYYGSFEDISFGLLYRAEKKYIIDKLIYDKSKGNDFEKLDKYIQDNKERIFKIFLEEDWQYGVDIKIKLNILGSIDFDKKKEEFYDFEGQNIKIVDNSIEEIETFNSNYYDLRDEREKLFFNKLIKFENINWDKYMSYMGEYPILRIVIFEDYGDESPIMDEITVDDPKEKVEKLKEFYKELEQFYNTDTFRFVIRDSELF